VSRRHLSALEKGANISVLVFTRVCEVLSIRPSELFEVATPQSHYHSVFISYGGPDEGIARRIYDELTSAGVLCFFFPVSATPGVRLFRTMADAIRRYDRVVLLCSMAGLGRPGVSNEIAHVLAREAEEGGTELIIPVALDDCLFSGAAAIGRDVIAQLRQRVIADFRGALSDVDAWQRELQRLLSALHR
jgi:hypothetical protein